MLDCEMLPRRARTIDFNLTGTDGMIGVAVSAGVRVGIDCERWDRKMRFAPHRVAKRWLAQQEYDQLIGVRIR